MDVRYCAWKLYAKPPWGVVPLASMSRPSLLTEPVPENHVYEALMISGGWLGQVTVMSRLMIPVPP